LVKFERDEPIATYTQTYSTASRTVPNATWSSMGDLLAVQNTGWGATNEADFDKITTAVDQLGADVLALKKVVTAIVDDLQSMGIVK